MATTVIVRYHAEEPYEGRFGVWRAHLLGDPKVTGVHPNRQAAIDKLIQKSAPLKYGHRQADYLIVDGTDLRNSDKLRIEVSTHSEAGQTFNYSAKLAGTGFWENATTPVAAARTLIQRLIGTEEHSAQSPDEFEVVLVGWNNPSWYQ